MIPTSFVDVFLRLALAAGLGGAIGLEREYRRKPAGIRTNMLIGLGSALFAILSIELGTAAGSPDRVAAQVVTGIGFLGAGAILRSGQNVHGLTTAATIWVNSAIGMATGLGLYTVAAGGATLTLVVLALLPLLERVFDERGGSTDDRP
ncbi:MAG TPA: MgtC/SapB family protein [Vicinamibacterales bacterium]|nr:MgtC/SapB family protein [Vicinamibacterales bacterium]